MSNYYAIINGERYNASLINNARFRTRSPGDGRISVQDAQDLWQLVRDGGRITEIEKNTLAYLQEAFNWTDAARAWLDRELSTEVEKINSYYRVIDGLRYDRKILTAADRRVASQGDGRISREDAEQLLPLFGDFGDITIVEERTLQYLFAQYHWTAAAAEWFQEKVDQISKQSSIEPLLRSILRDEFGFRRMPFAYYKSEAVQQMLDYKNKVSLPTALCQALTSLLEDEGEQSFGAIGYSSEPVLSSFPAPSRGESIRAHWLFGLELFDLTDDIYWVVVPRDGSGPAYNYLGGPNVGDAYHTVEGATYFTLLVEAGQEPYPGVPVEVRDPTGKYIVGKSDDDGRVFVTGPAGTYTVYASDGWRAQSKHFSWDGTGKEQVRKVVLEG